MKKITLCLLVIFLVACGNKSLMSSNDDIIESTKVEMLLSQSESSLFMWLLNHGEQEYTFAQEFTIEKMVDDEWYIIPTTIVENGDVTLKPYDFNAVDLPISKLEDGKYRIVKEFYDGENIEKAVGLFEVVNSSFVFTPARELDVTKLSLSTIDEDKLSQDVEMKLLNLPVTLATKQLEIEIINRLDQELLYGTYATLEINIDNKWYAVPTMPYIGYNTVGIILNRNATNKYEFTFNDGFTFPSLPTGRYRLVKDFTVEGLGYNFYATTEFDVE